MSVRAGRGSRRAAAGGGGAAGTSAAVDVDLTDDSFIVIDDSAPAVIIGDSYPSSMPPLDMGGDVSQQQHDTPIMRLSQAAIDKARLKLDAADAALAAMRLKRKRKAEAESAAGREGVIDLTK